MTIATLVGAVVLAATAQPMAALSTDAASLVGTAAAQAVAISQLTAQEAADLAFMREEEKLAHDVYQELYDTWQLPIFQNIARSEQRHTNALKMLLDRYQIPDPAATTAPGVFANEELQALYDQLVADGTQSLAAALRVGGAIEEIDILDLQERVAHTTKADITRVYQSLLDGSYNHLRSFVSTLKTQTGESYQPQYLTQAAFDSIVGTSNGRGGRRGR
jgi:hypothetical protein